MKKALLAVAVAAFAQSALAAVATTPHDLTANGPNGAKYGTPTASYTGLTPCNFCHAVHKANASTLYAGTPLWNRQDLSAGGWTMYPAASLTGGVVDGTPNAASLTCLSCHEGSAVLGALFSTGGTNVLSGGTVASGQMDPVTSRALVTGRDLSNDHPVSFPYAATGTFPAITNAGTSAANVAGVFPLYGANFNRMECATCHDPHDNQHGRFLRQAPADICATCHVGK